MDEHAINCTVCSIRIQGYEGYYVNSLGEICDDCYDLWADGRELDWGHDDE